MTVIQRPMMYVLTLDGWNNTNTGNRGSSNFGLSRACVKDQQCRTLLATASNLVGQWWTDLLTVGFGRNTRLQSDAGFQLLRLGCIRAVWWSSRVWLQASNAPFAYKKSTMGESKSHAPFSLQPYQNRIQEDGNTRVLSLSHPNHMHSFRSKQAELSATLPDPSRYANSKHAQCMRTRSGPQVFF
jgi:hypothetical protein